ncbi:NAD-dependent epimerase/dehydratase family protein [Alkalicoccobacillus murimartini]|uniref:UDP-glucose 4-epimerase n=1 Tax=Alkalicoccobacillus murimartini TaxID=171685 RepID=A0ABT9YJZ6_9BACI|nr:NAD(P)-dependent oxidoreductase [Alkalicoccobacillus murimartini]MDQ0207928.1 UDP-glucose 4-epimerase [Alkalicoccobacillus murimartini]
MKRAVVTGGLGFIGYHLCQALLENGVQVVCIDQRKAEREHEQDEKVMGMGRNSLFQHLDGDLSKENKKIVEEVSTADVVFHLASPSTKDSKWPTMNQISHQACTWIQFLCHSMQEHSRLLFPSTVEVYGDVPGLITENTPLQPTSPYGMIKAEVERCIQKEAEAKSIHYDILRLPTIYGPWQRSDMTFAQLLNEEQNVYQDRSTLDVLYVEDVVKGFILAAESTNPSDIYHLTSGQEGQWFQAAESLGAEAEVLKRTHSRSSLSPDKAREQLGFDPTTSLEEGLLKQKDHLHKWKERQNL